MKLRFLITPFNLILILLIFGLAMLLQTQLNQKDSHSAAQSTKRLHQAPEQAQTASSPSKPLSFYSEIERRPLFSPTRRPVAEVVEATRTSVQEVPNLNIELLGVIFSPAAKIAVVRDLSKGRIINAREGARLMGWDLRIVAEDQIELTHGEQSRTYRIFDYGGNEPTNVAPANSPPTATKKTSSRPSGQRPINDQP